MGAEISFTTDMKLKKKIKTLKKSALMPFRNDVQLLWLLFTVYSLFMLTTPLFVLPLQNAGSLEDWDMEGVDENTKRFFGWFPSP